MKTWLKRGLALLLAAVMALGCAAVEAPETAQAATDNTTVETAQDISSGEKTVGVVADNDHAYYYVYTAKESGYVSFSFGREDTTVTTNADWDIFLYDGRMNEVDYWYYEDEVTSSNQIVQEGDQFYVKVYDGRTQETNVSFYVQANFTSYPHVEAEGNDSGSAATKLSLDQEVLGSISDSNDADYYSFKADKSGIYSFAFDRYDFSDTSSAKWYYTLYDSKMNELCKLNTDTNSDGIGLRYVLAKGKTIYIKISDYSSSSNVLYSIKATCKKTVKNIETEPNNDYASADKIKLSTAYTGCLSESSTGDYFSVKASKKGTYKVSLSLSNDITYAYKVTVYDSSHNKIAESSEIYKKGSVKFKAKKGKKYYVVVSHANGTWGGKYYGVPYTLKVVKK